MVKILQLTHDNHQGLIVQEDADETIENFCHWQHDHRSEDDEYDLAILVTRKDICRMKNGEKSCNTLGLGNKLASWLEKVIIFLNDL